MRSKFLLFGILFMAIFATSCSSSKSATESTSVDMKKKLFNGTWVLSYVEEDKGLQLAPDLMVFGLGDAQCFKGSVWNLVSNNNTGVINLAEGTACVAGSYNTMWTVSGDTYNFKFIDSRNTAKHVTTGYSLKILSIDENNMRLQTTVSFLNKQCPIVFHFEKQQ
ncbi:MAG: lipocalin family protein [Mangrovibacterium sp.]